MPQKSKLPPEFKIKIVEDYLEGRIGASSVRQEYDISTTTLRVWVNQYQTQGPQGLVPKLKISAYSAELKQQVVQEYLAGKGSYRDLCKKYVISKPEIIRRWIKKYNDHGTLRIS